MQTIKEVIDKLPIFYSQPNEDKKRLIRESKQKAKLILIADIFKIRTARGEQANGKQFDVYMLMGIDELHNQIIQEQDKTYFKKH